MTRARVIARIALGEIEFLFGQFKMASNFFNFDLAYLLNGYFTLIKPPQRKIKTLKMFMESYKKAYLSHDSHKKAPKLLRCP